MQLGANPRILVYRLGSIGDMVVSLPCLHLIRQLFPGAIINLLTNRPVEGRAAPAFSVVENSGLVNGSISYPHSTRDFFELWKVRTKIENFRPDLLVYLTARQKSYELYRDYTFFRCCGIRQSVGYPFQPTLRTTKPPTGPAGLWESEASRLARCLESLGAIDLAVSASWDLHLTADEIGEADLLLAKALPSNALLQPMIGLCVGTKQSIKDWGGENWRKVLSAVARSDLSLVLIGSAEEKAASASVAQIWPGPIANLCGQCSPRVSAAAMRHFRVLMCHDSGPMHLAAAVGTRCLAIFSKHNLPGQWFPYGEDHTILYPPADSSGIGAIRPEDVISAASKMLSDSSTTSPAKG